MSRENDDLSNEILALVNDTHNKGDSSDDERPRRHKRSGNDSDSNLSASSSDLSVRTEEDREISHRKSRKSYQESSSEEEKNLSHLTEIEREQIIAEKAEKHQKKYERQEILSRLNKQKKSAGKGRRSKVVDSDEGSDQEFLPSARPSRSKASQSQALKELKDRRNKKKNQAFSSSSGESSQENDTYESPRRYESTPDEVDDSPVITRIEDLQPIILRRDYLASIVHDRLLEKTIIGCFVSVAFGSRPDGSTGYRLGKITKVIETKDSYVLESTRTHRLLELAHGPDKLSFGFDVISNQPLSQSEFSRYMESCRAANMPPLTSNHVSKKKAELNELDNRAQTNEDHEYSMRSHQRSTVNTQVLVVSRKFLEGRIRVARDLEDSDEVARLEEELADLNAHLDPLLEKYEEERRKNEEAERVQKNAYVVALAEAAERRKMMKNVEVRQKRKIDSDEEEGKATCFSLKAPKISPPSAPLILPSLSINENLYESAVLTRWEKAAALIKEAIP